MMLIRQSLVGLALAAACAGAAWAQNTDELKATLQKRFPEGHIRSISESPSIKGWYEVVTDDELVYTNSDASLLFVGRLVDTVSKRDLTGARWNAMQSIDFKALPLNLAVKTVKGNGSRTLAVFADPHCPFCQELERELLDVDDITVYTFLYPLEAIHPGATAQAENIWCATDKSAAWSDWMLKKKAAEKAASCDAHALQTLQDLGNKLKINSTPTLFFADGHRVSGVIDRKVLEDQLAAVQPTRAAQILK